jgi:hypothetical protein
MEKRKIQLRGEEKLFLRHYISKGSHSARSIGRARMLLLLDEGSKNQKQIALDCNCSEGTVTNLVKRYAECKGLVKQVLEEKPAVVSPPSLPLNWKPTSPPLLAVAKGRMAAVAGH